jgi:hypothetical protein
MLITTTLSVLDIVCHHWRHSLVAINPFSWSESVLSSLSQIKSRASACPGWWRRLACCWQTTADVDRRQLTRMLTLFLHSQRDGLAQNEQKLEVRKSSPLFHYTLVILQLHSVSLTCSVFVAGFFLSLCPVSPQPFECLQLNRLWTTHILHKQHFWSIMICPVWSKTLMGEIFLFGHVQTWDARLTGTVMLILNWCQWEICTTVC